MIREFEQYRFARIEGRNVTRARLQSQFKDGIKDLEELEKAITLELAMETPCAPWRRSEWLSMSFSGNYAGKYQVQIAIVPLDSISWVDLPVFPPS